MNSLYLIYFTVILLIYSNIFIYGDEINIELPSHYQLKKCKHGNFLLNDYDMDISEHMRLYGEWAENELQLFLSIIKEGDIVIDAGANIGAFTVPLAKKVGYTGHIHAFEPQKIINQRLNANIALNGLENVDVYLAALGNETGSITVPILNYSIISNFGALSLAEPLNNNNNQEWSYKVPMLRLDDINFYNPYTGLNCPSFIKMDVERMEKYVLQGGIQTIKRCLPIIHTENNSEKSSKGLIEQLYLMDYIPYWELQPAFNSIFHTKYIDITNGYINMNMICIPKYRLKTHGGDITMEGFIQVLLEKPYLKQYFLIINEDGTISSKLQQHE